MGVQTKRYRDLNSFLRDKFACRVQKIPLDAGFSCPNRDGSKGRGGCIYCGATGSGTGAYKRMPDIRDQMEQGMRFFGKRYKARRFIAYFQGFSNTYGPEERLERLYRSALISEEVVGLSIGTRPDCINDKILDVLERLAAERMVWVEYGLQSSHEQTLNRINRGHTLEDFISAVHRTQHRGILICAHLILGLPGEDRTMMRQTAESIAGLNLDGLKIHLLYVLKNTKMEEIYRRGHYTCLKMDEYADLVVDVLERMPPATVIQRLTGDPNPLSDLVAPDWAVKKSETLRFIDRRLEERDTFQGKMYREKHDTAVTPGNCRVS